MQRTILDATESNKVKYLLFNNSDIPLYGGLLYVKCNAECFYIYFSLVKIAERKIFLVF